MYLKGPAEVGNLWEQALVAGVCRPGGAAGCSLLSVVIKCLRLGTLETWYFAFKLPSSFGRVRLDCSQLRTVRRHGFGLSSSAGLAKWLADIIEKRDAIHAAVDKKLESIGLRLQEAERKIEVVEITIIGPNAVLAENAKDQVVSRAEVQLMIWKISADWELSSRWENLVDILMEQERDSFACCRAQVELH